MSVLARVTETDVPQVRTDASESSSSKNDTARGEHRFFDGSSLEAAIKYPRGINTPVEVCPGVHLRGVSRKIFHSYLSVCGHMLRELGVERTGEVVRIEISTLRAPRRGLVSESEAIRVVQRRRYQQHGAVVIEIAPVAPAKISNLYPSTQRVAHYLANI